MNLVDYAKSELEILEQNCGDDTEALNMQKIVTENVLNIVKTLQTKVIVDFLQIIS